MKKNNEYVGIATLEVLEWAKNYNNWISDKIRKHLVYPSLEVGSGTGNITKLVVSQNEITVSDADPKLITYLKKRFKDKKNVSYANFNIDKNPPKELQNKYASAFGVNVLEHIKDDVGALKKIGKTLKKNGRIVLLVPAKQFAYSELDKQLGHYRRYEKQELITKLEKAGYVVEHIEFFNIVGLVSWVARNKIERNHYQLRPYQIKMFEFLVPMLRRIEAIIHVPVGISLIAVAKKK